MKQKYITLLPGTQLLLGEYQTLVLPEEHEDVLVGDVVVLENQQREVVGTALIEDKLTMCFAHLQNWHFSGTAHLGLTSWGVAADTLKELVPGFSITDMSTVFAIKVDTLLEPSLTVSAARESTDEEPVEVPSVEAILADLDTAFVEESE